MPWYTGWIVGGLVAGLVALVAVGLAARHRAYRRQLRYNPRVDYAYDLKPAARQLVPVEWADDGLTAPAIGEGVGAALVTIRVSATAAGRVVDPYLEVEAGGEVIRQYFERGANGLRYLNVSRLFRGGWAGGRVRVSGRYCRWRGDEPTLYLFDEVVRPGDRVVVVAPHPDDAEIAAFGVYSDTDAVVVTVTAGDASDRYDQLGPLPPGFRARLRVWDSITVPRLGGVPPDRAINLGYPDGRLAELAADPRRDCRNDLDFDGLRGMNLSPLVRGGAVCTWESLVEDLAHVFRQVRPTAVVTPSPTHDTHPDHRHATLAVCEALGRAGLPEGRLLLCVIHNRWTELFPFGPAAAGVGLPPRAHAGGDDHPGVYSHPLSPETRTGKYFALEMMHDIRDFPPGRTSFRVCLRRFVAHLKALIHGMGSPPTCLLRRAPRPDEVFFVLPYGRGCELLAGWRADEAATGAERG